MNHMSPVVKKLLAEIMQLPDTERAVIAEELIATLEPRADQHVEEAWQLEVIRRALDIDQGEVQCLPWEVVREKLRNSSAAH